MTTASQPSAGNSITNHLSPVVASTPRRLSLRGSFEAVLVEGIPGLSEPRVRGPHRSYRDGDLMVVEGEYPRESVHCTVSGPNIRGRWAVGQADPSSLVVAMSPEVELTAEVAVAAALEVRGLRSPIHVRLETGLVRLHDVPGPLDVAIGSGTVTLAGVLSAPQSLVRCDTGSIDVVFAPGSNVDARAMTGVGTARVAGDAGSQTTGAGERCQLMVGDGDGSLEVVVGVGSVSLRLDAA